MNSGLRYTLSLCIVLAVTTITCKHLRAQGNDSSLIAWWSFDDGTANDKSSYGHNGVMIGNPQFVPGPCGSAISFNGGGEYIQIPKSPKLTGMTQMTLCYWIKFYNNDPNAAGNTIGNGSDDLPYAPGFYTYSGYSEISHFLGLQPNARGIRTPYDATIPLDQQDFSFIVFVVTTDSLKAYRNGCLVETISRDGWPLTRDYDWFIGWSGDFAGDGAFLQGMMDEIRIYDRPLSEQELFDLYTQCGGAPITADYPDRKEVCEGEASLLDGMVIGGTKPYTYSWSPPVGLNSTTSPTPVATPSTTTTYTLTATDAMGCSTWHDVTVVVNDCSEGTPDYSDTLLSLCPGTRKRDYVLFHDLRNRIEGEGVIDTIVGISFSDENGTNYAVDTTLPLVLSSAGEVRIPILYSGGMTGLRTGVMKVTGANGKVVRVLLSAEVISSDIFTVNFTTLRVNPASGPLDTCIQLTSIYPVEVNITDTVWMASHANSRLLSPSLPVRIGSGKSIDLCFHLTPGTHNDTLIFGAESTDEEYLTCVSHVIIIDRTSTLSVDNVVAGGSGLRLFPLYPNPTTAEVAVRFALPKSGKVDVDILNDRGEKIRSILEQVNLDRGEHLLHCDASGIESGLYFIQVKFDGEVQIRGVVVTR